MASIATYNDILNRIGGNFTNNQHFWNEVQTAFTSSALGNNSLNKGHVGFLQAFPSLPAGVTAYMPTYMEFGNSSINLQYVVGKMVLLGTFDISNNATGFTVGSAMPTVTELNNASQPTASAVYMEVTTALNATPGSITVTYVDQDGNASETTTAQVLGPSCTIGSTGMVVLNSTDWGARSISAATQSGGTTPSGIVKFWGLVPLGFFNLRYPILCPENFLTSHFNLQRFGAGDQLGIFVFATNVHMVFGRLFTVADS